MLGDGTLIQNTVMRLLPFVSAVDVWVVTTRDLAHLVEQQLPLVSADHIILEPFARNTGPSIGLAASVIKASYNEDVVVVVLPSDHLVMNVREFQVTLDRACVTAASTEAIVTIGVTPTRSETAYGYIQVGDALDVENPVLKGKVHSVRTFAEKPDLATAQRFIDAGDFVWNSGIFVARAHVIIDAIDHYLPDHGPLLHLAQKAYGTAEYDSVLEYQFRQMRSVSFDVGVMEKATNVCVVDGAFGWSDVGTWDELYRLSMKDGKNNVIEGNVVTVNTHSCFVSSQTGRLIGVVGVDNLVVVETDQALMITKRGKTTDVRDLVELLRRRHIGGHQ